MSVRDYTLSQADIGLIGKMAHLAKTGKFGYIPFDAWEVTLTSDSIDTIAEDSKYWHHRGDFFRGKNEGFEWIIFEKSKIKKDNLSCDIIYIDLHECRARVSL